MPPVVAIFGCIGPLFSMDAIQLVMTELTWGFLGCASLHQFGEATSIFYQRKPGAVAD
jgi:hypothetical protein